MIYLMIGLVLNILMDIKLGDDSNWTIGDRVRLLVLWPLIIIMVVYTLVLNQHNSKK